MRNKSQQKRRKLITPKPGQKATLTELPPGLLDNLPGEDQRAIAEVVGKPVMLNRFDEDGRAELEWGDYLKDVGHTIWVEPKFIKLW
jgi:hypothetical protein